MEPNWVFPVVRLDSVRFSYLDYADKKKQTNKQKYEQPKEQIENDIVL